MGTKSAKRAWNVVVKAVELQEKGKSLVLENCRTAFEEGDHSSYEITESEYSVSDDEYLWVDRLLNTLAIVLQWFQPLLTMNNYDSLVFNLLAKVCISTSVKIGKRMVLSAVILGHGLLPKLSRTFSVISVTFTGS